MATSCSDLDNSGYPFPGVPWVLLQPYVHACKHAFMQYVRLHGRIHKDIDSSGCLDRFRPPRHMRVQAMVFNQQCKHECSLPKARKSSDTRH